MLRNYAHVRLLPTRWCLQRNFTRLKAENANQTGWDMKYCISPNKRVGHGGRKRTLILVWFRWNSWCDLLHTLPTRPENVNKIGYVSAEIWPAKVKSEGAHLFRQARLFVKIWYVSWIRFLTFLPQMLFYSLPPAPWNTGSYIAQPYFPLTL